MTTFGPWSEVMGERSVGGDATVLVDRSVEPGETHHYRLRARVAGGEILTFGPITGSSGQAVEFALSMPFPNPAQATTRLDFTVGHEAHVKLSVMDLQGRQVAVLADGVYPSGCHRIAWDGRSGQQRVPVGIYFVRYRTPNGDTMRRLAVTR